MSSRITRHMAHTYIVKPVTAFLLAAASSTAVPQAFAQLVEAPPRDSPERTEKVEPFHIIDNVYFVGKTVHNPAYLFTGGEGHILVDSTFEEFVPDILENIEKLGFQARDIKILLSSHAHHDHVGGHAMLKEMTGAEIMASDGDAEVIETGGIADFRDDHPWRAAEVDVYLRDRQIVSLGDIRLIAHLTPGHTRGCTTWTTEVKEAGQTYHLVLVCGFRMDADSRLVGNPDYPSMPQDFAYTFAVAKTLPVDVFLGAHGYWFNLKDKIELLQQDSQANPFLNAGEYHRLVEAWEKAFLQRLKEERAGGVTYPQAEWLMPP